MKRILLLVLTLLCLCSTAFAETSHVYNPDGILSDAQAAEFEATMSQLCDKYDIDLILAVPMESAGTTADDLLYPLMNTMRPEYEHPDTAILIVCVASRTYRLQAYGRMSDAIESYGWDLVESRTLTRLSDDDFAGAASAWLDCITELCTPKSAFAVALDYMIIVLILAIIIALIVVGILKSQLKTAKFQRAASGYVDKNSLSLRNASEIFLYETVTVRRIETNHSNGGHRGGGSRSSSGRSGSF